MYEAFNVRDIDAVLRQMTEDVGRLLRRRNAIARSKISRARIALTSELHDVSSLDERSDR
jgi:hypothetical protein